MDAEGVEEQTSVKKINDKQKLTMQQCNTPAGAMKEELGWCCTLRFVSIVYELFQFVNGVKTGRKSNVIGRIFVNQQIDLSVVKMMKNMFLFLP